MEFLKQVVDTVDGWPPPRGYRLIDPQEIRWVDNLYNIDLSPGDILIVAMGEDSPMDLIGKVFQSIFPDVHLWLTTDISYNCVSEGIEVSKVFGVKLEEIDSLTDGECNVCGCDWKKIRNERDLNARGRVLDGDPARGDTAH